MRLNKFMLAMAAVSMTASPVLAASAAPAPVRAANQGGESELFGGGFVVALLAVAAVVAGIIIIADNDDDATGPTSP